MSRLSILTLGSFQVTLDDVVITDFRSDKARALLAYLAVNADRPHRRETLAALFWPECSADAARNNLRQTLYSLRQALSIQGASPESLIISQRDIRFDPASDHWLDVAAFTDLLKPCPAHAGKPTDICSICAEDLRQAVALYHGDFLAGLSLEDAVGFDEWMRSRQEQYHTLALETMQRLADWHERRREYQLAASYARRELELEPWREEAHCGLMRVLTLSGQRSAALHQYELCRLTLGEALAVEPAPATTDLYRRILAQTFHRPDVFLANPYKGLQSFAEQDAADFFGREAFVDRLALAVRQQPLVAVIGPSGSGKSSLICAGLMPRLGLETKAGEGPHWIIIRFRPGRSPFERLAEALLAADRSRSVDVRQAAVSALASAIAAGEMTVADALAQVLSHHPEADRLLLVTDQFEELFTLTPLAETRDRFIEVLLEAVEPPEGASMLPDLCLLISLRADFMGQALAHRPLADALQQGIQMLGPMSPQEMTRAIEEPARELGIVFEPGLVARLLDDVGQRPGALPLLEFALTLLWEKRSDGVLAHEVYDRIGGVQGALAHYAEDVYGALQDDEKQHARQVFVQLVRPGQQTDDTRRAAFRTDLGEEGWAMAQRLADARLAVTGRDPFGREVVEIVHEALIPGWQRLKEWIDADRAFRLWQEGLRTVFAQWEATGRDPGGLLRGAPLASAEEWLAVRALDLDAATRDFVTRSIAQREAEAQAAEARRQHELEQARALVAAETGARHRMRRLSLVLAILVVVASIAAGAAVRGSWIARDFGVRAQAAQATAEAERGQTILERNRAETQARLALSRQLAAQSSALLATQPDLALLLGLEAESRSADPVDRAGIRLDLQLDPYLARFLHGPAAPIYLAAFGRDAQTLSTLTADGIITRWSVSPGRAPVATQLAPSAGTDVAVGISPDGSRAALGSGRLISVWDLTTGQQLQTALAGHSADVRILAFSADNHTLLSGDKSGKIVRWNVTTGISNTVPFTDTGNAVWALSPDAERLAMTEDPGDAELAPIVIRSVTTGSVVAPRLLGHRAADGIHGLVFSHNGKLLASSSFDKTTILWDTATGHPLHPPLVGHTARTLVAAFSPDDNLLATGGTDYLVFLWDVATGRQVGIPLKGHGNWVRALAWSPDGRTLASASADGTTILWGIGRKRQFTGFAGKVRGLAFTPDGRTLYAGCFDQTVRRYDVAGGTQLVEPYPGDGHSVLNLSLSPDARTVAAASASGDATLLDATTLRPVGLPLQGHTGPLMAAIFSPDGRTLATSSFDHSIILWDVATHRRLAPPLVGHKNWVLTLAFSPDGSILASGSADSTIVLWDVKTQRALGQPLQKHTNWVTGLVFSPDGKQLASTSSDNTVQLWNVETREPVGLPLEGHATQVWSVAFDPLDQGRTLVTAGANGSVIRWDLTSHIPLAPALLGNVETESMALSPDGQTVALGGYDEKTSLWELDRRPWAERACEIADRNLTQAEWQRYLHDEPFHKTCDNLP